jgi:preprotein translocase subunit SecE
VTDFRGEHFPKKERLSRPSSRAGNAYLVRAMAKISPFKFLQEVRAEAQKVTWPTRKETTVTTIMVFVMVVIASIFFLLADQVMRIAVSFLLGING